MGGTYALEVEVISKPRDEYQSDAYQRTGLPPAPAVMVGDEVVAQGPDITTEKLDAAIRRHLGQTP